MKCCFQTAPYGVLPVNLGKVKLMHRVSDLGWVLIIDPPPHNLFTVDHSFPPSFFSLGKEKPVAAKGPESGPEWLKQFDAMLPGYSLKNELDILTLLKQVEKEGGTFPRMLLFSLSCQ